MREPDDRGTIGDLLSRLADWFGWPTANPQAEVEPGAESRSLEEVNYGGVTDINFSIDRAIRRQIGGEPSGIASVFRCEQLITDAVASLHMEQADEKTNLIDEDTPDLLRRPNPAEPYIDTISKIVASLLYDGNAYIRPLTRDRVGNILTCHVLMPHEVTVTWDRNRIFPIYAWRDRNMRRDQDIIHIALNFKRDGHSGMGPIEAARTLLQRAMHEQETSLSLAKDNLNPTAIINVSNKTQDEVDAAQARIDAAVAEGHTGVPRIISDAKWEQLTLKPADAQWIESQNFTVQDIGRLFGIHGLHLNVDAGSSLTYSTTESVNRMLLTRTIRPTYLTRIEEAFSRMLPRGKVARFNVDEMLEADTASLYQALQIGVGNRSFLTVNEARRMIGRKPISGGDELPPVPDSSPPSAAPGVPNAA